MTSATQNHSVLVLFVSYSVHYNLLVSCSSQGVVSLGVGGGGEKGGDADEEGGEEGEEEVDEDSEEELQAVKYFKFFN